MDINMTDDKLEDVFGEEFAQQINNKVEEQAQDDQEELLLRMQSVLECVNKAFVDVEFVLANMDADENPHEFETLEEVHSILEQIEDEISSDEYSNLQQREYELS